MRYKVAPPMRSLAALGDAREAIPLVPDDEADCCRAIKEAIGCPTRDRAREYLTFLQALGLVAQSDRGYHRTRVSVDDPAAVAAFRRDVFAVEELLTALESGPLDADGAFDAVRDVIPQWERNRHADWEATWRDRIENLLSWAVTFDILHRTPQGYALK